MPGPVEIPRNLKWQRSVVRTIGLALIRTVYRIRTTGTENIPEKGGALLLPNHVTFADAFFITGASRRPVRFVMDEAFMAHPAIRWFCTIFDTVTIRKDQSREAIRITIDAINNGDIVCFFPEGQLSRSGTLNEIKRGVELIAKKAGTPFIPMWVDGAWGSIFSFEHNVFFRKRPHRIPHDLYVAFGPPTAPSEANIDSIRASILKASAAALALRCRDAETPEEINGYQIGQINALPWRESFGVLYGDALPAAFENFSGRFGSLIEARAVPETIIPRWVGGNALRAWAESPADDGMEIDFYDFSDRALVPLERAGVRHFPCLAIEGKVVAMSMPDPPKPHRGSNSQPGRKAGTWGKLLPGWFIEDGRIKGPACAKGLPMPEGSSMDSDGFIVPG